MLRSRAFLNQLRFQNFVRLVLAESSMFSAHLRFEDFNWLLCFRLPPIRLETLGERLQLLVSPHLADTAPPGVVHCLPPEVSKKAGYGWAATAVGSFLTCRDVNVSFFLWSNSSFFIAPLKKKLCFVSFLFEIQKQKNVSKYFDIEKDFFLTFTNFFLCFSFFVYVSFLQNKISRIQQI